ncbi:MAG TPA: DUF3048 domain-containing protein [Candidatus Limnocylindria bacterium]|nr:DUF3048 domain-containing protein [Candidatus Limnocylindria bacterium]
MRALPILIALVIAACGGGGSPAPAASGSAPAAQKAVWPLRGTNAPSADATGRRPVMVRVPNDPAARPQSGLAKADIVFELLVEGGITRYALVFHSEEADKVGPIRSARLSDLHLAPMLRAILAHVGAQTQTLERIREAAKAGQFVDVDQFQSSAAFDRVSDRPAPQNVYTSTQRIREAAKDTAKVQVPPLAFGESKAQGKPATTLTIPYTGSGKVTYEPSGDGFKRAQAGQPTVDDGREVAPANVIVIKTEITEVPGYVEDEHGSLSLDIRSTGSGPVVVLTAGKRFDGTWERSGAANFSFKDASGTPILLRPGLSWVHIVPISFDLGS